MNIAEVLAIYDQQERREMRYPDVVRDVVPPIARHINVPGGAVSSFIQPGCEQCG